MTKKNSEEQEKIYSDELKKINSEELKKVPFIEQTDFATEWKNPLKFQSQNQYNTEKYNETLTNANKLFILPNKTHILKIIQLIDNDLYLNIISHKPNINEKNYDKLTEYLFKNWDTIVKSLNLDKQTLNNEMNKQLCIYQTYIKFYDKCNHRVIEGMMINKSLADNRDDIKSLVISTTFPAIMIYSDESPYCTNLMVTRNPYTQEDPYSRMYKLKRSTETTGSIARTMYKLLNGNIDKIVYAFLTVINLSEKDNIGNDYQNPPPIPYININRLKYYAFVDKDIDKCYKTLGGIRDRLILYPYYTNELDKSLLSVKLIEKDNSNNYKENINNYSIEKIQAIVNEIDKVNSSTVIGALEASERIRKTTNPEITCVESTDNTILNDTDNIETKILNMYPELVFKGVPDMNITEIKKYIDSQEQTPSLELKLL
jgi:hypothetical protein